jgi:hypothetical protein
MDWEKIKRNAYSKDTPPSDWPEGVNPISMDGLSLFGLDKKRKLYWNGKPVETKLYLSSAAKIATIMGIILAGLVSIKEILEFFGINNYQQLIGG